MAGQQQLRKLDKQSYYNKFHKELLRQADLYYTKDKFEIQTEYDIDKFYHAYLYQNFLCTDNCELISFINKKIRGALGNENIKIVDLHTMQTQYRDINNYFFTASTYEEVEW